MLPQGGQQILSPALQLSHPLALRQGAQDLPGQILVPAAYSGQRIGRPAPKHSGEHDPKDFSQKLPHSLQPPLDLNDQGLWQPQLDQRLFQGLQVALRAPARVGAVRGTSGGDAVWLCPLVVARVTGWPGVPPVVSGLLGVKEPMA